MNDNNYYGGVLDPAIIRSNAGPALPSVTPPDIWSAATAGLPSSLLGSSGMSSSGFGSLGNVQNPSWFSKFANSLASPAGVSALGSLGGSIIGGLFSNYQQNKQNNFNAEQAQLARDFNAEQAQIGRDWQESMWNKENEYNTPAAQLQRLMDAGINPSTAVAMMSGSGASGSAGSAGAAPTASGSAATASGVGDYGSTLGAVLAGIPSQIYDNILKQKEAINKKLDNKMKSVDAEYYRQKIENEMSILESQSEQAKNEVEKGKYEVEIKRIGVSQEIVKYGILFNELAMSNMDTAMHQQFLDLDLRIKNAEAMIAETRSQYEKDLIIEQINTMRAQQASLFANAALAGAQKEGIDLDNIAKQFENSKLDEKWDMRVKQFNQNLKNQKVANRNSTINTYTGAICSIASIALDVTGAVMTGGMSTAVRGMTSAPSYSGYRGPAREHSSGPYQGNYGTFNPNYDDFD